MRVRTYERGHVHLDGGRLLLAMMHEQWGPLPLAPEMQDMPIVDVSRPYQREDRRGKSAEIAANLGLKTIILTAFSKLISQ